MKESNKMQSPLVETVEFDEAYLELYGETSKREFRKEYLERQYNIYDGPNYCTKGMVFFTILTELVLCSYLVFTILMANHLDRDLSKRKKSDDIVSILNDCNLTEFLSTIDEHVIWMVVCFGFLIHQSVILEILFDFCGIHHFNLWVLITRMSACILYITIGDVVCKTNKVLSDTNPNDERLLPFNELDKESIVHETMIYKSPTTLAHHYSAGITGVLLFIYTFLNLTKAILALKCFHCLYHIPVIGKMLLIICQNEFLDSILYILNIMGLITLISGYYDWFDWHRKAIKYNADFESSMELNLGYYVTIAVILIVIYFLLGYLKSQRHVIAEHEKFITTSDFANILDAMDGRLEGSLAQTDGNKFRKGKDVKNTTKNKNSIVH